MVAGITASVGWGKYNARFSPWEVPISEQNCLGLVRMGYDAFGRGDINERVHLPARSRHRLRIGHGSPEGDGQDAGIPVGAFLSVGNGKIVKFTEYGDMSALVTELRRAGARA
jgi:hypothetical protein